MKKFFSVVFVLLAVAALVRADYYVKSKYHSDPMNMPGASQPAKDEIHEQWIGGDKFANITPDMSIVMDLGKSKAWLINHKDKTYVETALPLDMAKLLPPEMAGMMGMMKPTVAVESTGAKKTLGQWACSGYNVSITMMMMPIKMSVWATENVPFDLNTYLTKMFSNYMKGALRLDDASIAEMKKVKGFWISQEMSMDIMGTKINSSSQVQEITQKAAGPGVYSIPAGYTQAKFLSMR